MPSKEFQDYFKNNFNTPLSPINQKIFDEWIQKQSQLRGRDMSRDMADYDLAGHWLNGGYKDQGDGHMPDTYKKPNHPTFSNESIYHGSPSPWGGIFKGGVWGADNSYMPSYEMLQTTHNPMEMQQYFQQQEPDSKLVLPQ